MTTPDAGALRGCLTDPSRTITFNLEGRSIPAIEGQSIGAALYAAGRRVFSRSFKYHRPRGLFCVAGDCPNCLMHVDGRPNVRTCIEPARQGQMVRTQNAWPSVDFDVLRIFDKFSSFLPVGFYYKQFHKPRWLWPIFEWGVRHIAGLGRINVNDHPAIDSAVEYRHVEVCVVGGGSSGLAAANAAAAAGADVLLLERMPMLGGRLLYERTQTSEVSRTSEVLLNTTVFGLYEGNLLGAFQADRLLKIRAKQIIVCTGSRQPLVPFPNNDHLMIMSLGGVLRLGGWYGVRAGRRALVVSDQEQDAALQEQQLNALGIEVAARSSYPFSAATNVPFDLVCLATDPAPANELLLQGGMRFAFQSGRWQPEREVAGLFAAGGAAGIERSQRAADGRMRGWQAAAALGYKTPTVTPQSTVPPGHHGTTEAIRLSTEVGQIGKQFVCLCEDVTTTDIDRAVAEGFNGIETLKRYATVGMGPCQGKMCSLTAIALCARATGQELNAVGSTTSRPPAVPVELGVLAAERRHHPVRRTPLHHWHQAAGARWIDAGLWKRPESYGDPSAEVLAVRSGVGVMDVSTLGKIEVAGPQAAELLERVYLNAWSDLDVGKVRYGVMCTEEGIVFDDGVGTKLGPDHFFLTTTTGNAEAVFQWLQLWRTTWRLDAAVTNRTSALAAMNLAGPKARTVLGRLTSLDLSAAAIPYPAARQAEVAGVSCRLFRIGFVGEVGYEIHCASAHGWHVWDAIVNAGAEFGLRPFGVEAQRILRLEKGHLIVGQDTDALSDPFGAGLGRMVRFSKPLFHGRASLLRLKKMGPRTRLIGFELPQDLHADKSLEGCQVVEQGRPAGRVTSARFSPTLKKTIGLAWIPPERAGDGGTFLIRFEGRDLTARVTPLPFYDPEGKYLKS
jgi:sarcosine oxidase subunit alpha